jgi:hypothetical protein
VDVGGWERGAEGEIVNELLRPSTPAPPVPAAVLSPRVLGLLSGEALPSELGPTPTPPTPPNPEVTPLEPTPGIPMVPKELDVDGDELRVEDLNAEMGVIPGRRMGRGLELKLGGMVLPPGM